MKLLSLLKNIKGGKVRKRKMMKDEGICSFLVNEKERNLGAGKERGFEDKSIYSLNIKKGRKGHGKKKTVGD